MYASAKDLRFYAKELLETASNGEEVIITYHGKPCARLVPYCEGGEEVGENKAFGMWKDNKLVKDPKEFVRNLRKRRY